METFRTVRNRKTGFAGRAWQVVEAVRCVRPARGPRGPHSLTRAAGHAAARVNWRPLEYGLFQEQRMTRSIFDPGGGETEQSGSTFLGPHADNISHVPPDVVDGEADADADTRRADELPADAQTDSADV